MSDLGVIEKTYNKSRKLHNQKIKQNKRRANMRLDRRKKKRKNENIN